MTTEVDTFLAHYGVLGMKWGKSKAESQVSKNRKPGFFDKPRVAKALILNSYGKKSSYRSQEALVLRKRAGKIRIATWLATGAGTGVGLLAIKADPSTKAGLQIVAQTLSTGTSVLDITSRVVGAKGAYEENQYRIRNP